MRVRIQSYAARISGLPAFRHIVRRVGRWSGLLCLNYHRVGTPAGSVFDHGLWSATADAFNEQVRYLKRNYDVVTPHELPDVVTSGRGRYVLITFDDGYIDNYEIAFPILKRNGVPATFFIATGFLDEPRLAWWDEIAWMVRTSDRDRIDLRPWISAALSIRPRHADYAIPAILRALKRLPHAETTAFLDAVATATGRGRCPPDAATGTWMNWDMVREMRHAGMVIGGHTANHPVLSRMTPEQQEKEIQTCCARLAAETGHLTEYFSYPVGGHDAFDASTRAILSRSGIRLAFSYYGGYRSGRDWDDYDVRRVAIEREITGPWFRSITLAPQWFA